MFKIIIALTLISLTLSAIPANCARTKECAEVKCKECLPGYRATSDKCEAEKADTNVKAYDQKICNDGYFFDTDKCTKVTTVIANCTLHGSLTTCNCCASGFERAEDSKTCIAIADVANCKDFKTKTACKKCVTGYQVDADKCKKNEIANCKSNYKDQCNICNEGDFFLSSDKKKCEAATAIANCGWYADKTNCFKCKSTFFLKANKCEAGGLDQCSEQTEKDKCSKISGCDALDTAGTKCKTCKTGYTIDGNKCKSISDSRGFCGVAGTIVDSGDDCKCTDGKVAATACQNYTSYTNHSRINAKKNAETPGYHPYHDQSLSAQPAVSTDRCPAAPAGSALIVSVLMGLFMLY